MLLTECDSQFCLSLALIFHYDKYLHYFLCLLPLVIHCSD